MPVDTQIYQNANQPNNDPMAQITKAIQIRNAMGNINKLKGGMPGTQGAQAQLGAGQPYDSGVTSPPQDAMPSLADNN